MDQQRFLELEYNSLRNEIETAKANMFKLVIGGAGVIPAAQSLANTYPIGEITLALHLIVVVLVLLFLSENHSLMRAGTYILEEIEPKVEGGVGWETWLNSEQGSNGNRSVDKLLIFTFSLLAASYFLVSVVLAVRYALSEFGSHGQYLVGGGYICVGLVLVFILYSQAKTDTRN